MLKRSGALILTWLYIVTVTGFALNLHYCFNQITSVNINAPAKSCKMLSAGKMKCCKNTHLEVKVKDAHERESPSFFFRAFAFHSPGFCVTDFFIHHGQASTDKYIDRAPPDILSNSMVVFLKNCVFRI
jgi:hypothetical protein